MELRLKHVYDPAAPDDGFRVLVDRVWPRGLSKERAALDLWAKDTAPTTDLRHEWHAAPADQWETYAARYRSDLDDPQHGALVALAAELRPHPVVTLLYAVRDPQHNHAVVLREALLAVPA